MQLKLFVAPVKNIAAAGGDMHGFVHPHRVLTAKKELVPSGENSFPRGAASAMLAVVCRDGPPLALSLADRAWRAVTFPAFIPPQLPLGFGLGHLRQFQQHGLGGVFRRLNIGQDIRGQIEEAQGLVDVRYRLAHALGQVPLGQVEPAHQPPVGLGHFDRVQVLALDVLDELQFQARLLGHRPHDAEHGLPLQVATSREPPLTGEDVVPTILGGFDDHGLQEAMRADGSLQFLEVPQVLAGLIGVRVQQAQRNRDQPGFLARGRRQRRVGRAGSFAEHEFFQCGAHSVSTSWVS